MPDVSGYTLSSFDFPGSEGTRLYGINDKGSIVGDYITSTYDYSGSTIVSTNGYQGIFTYDADGTFANNEYLTEYNGGQHVTVYDTVNIPSGLEFAYALNNTGDVLESPNYKQTLYFINVNSGINGGASYHSMFNSRAFGYGINDAGTIVGTPGIADAKHGGQFSPITFPGATQTVAHDINNLGQIAGYYTDASGTHGFLESGSTFVAIDAPGAKGTEVLGLNDVGQLVGTYTDAAGHNHGFVEEGGRFSPIDVTGATDTFAFGINNAGEVVGYSTGSGGTHGFTATPSMAGLDTLILRTSEDAWAAHPDAQFIVAVDGVQVGGVLSTHAVHSAGESDTVTLTGNFAGAHQISVSFLNDQYGGPDADVNLYVDSVSLNGTTIKGSAATVDPSVGQSAGSAAELFKNGTATFTLDPDTLTVRVSEDQWANHPDAQFVVKVDGQQVGATQTVQAIHGLGQSQDVTFKGNFAEAHQISIAFVNDQYGGPNADVNLYVESVSLNGQAHNGTEATVDPSSGTYAGSSALLFRDGAAVINLDHSHGGALLV